MKCLYASPLVLMCAIGCDAVYHPAPWNAHASESASVSLLRQVVSSIDWHENGRVRSVSLVGNGITEEHIRALRDLKQLEELQLLCPLTDDNLSEVATLPSLRALDVQFTAITDDGLRHLSAAPALRLLVINGTATTDAGLLHLAAVPTLNKIFAEKTSISESGLKRFYQRRPDCIVQHDSGVIRAEQSDPRERPN